MIASLKTLLSKTHWDKTSVKKKECNLNSYLQFYNEKKYINQHQQPEEGAAGALSISSSSIMVISLKCWSIS